MASTSNDEKLYGVNDILLENVRKEKAWSSDPKYFKKVKISPSAAIKMMVHGQSGVEKGIKKSGKPIEVMGMLVGRPDTENKNCLIISDAQPLPIEGFETRVIADDESTINYMIELGEMNEETRKERFCGWYHTHPFDVEDHSHCYLSNTDISTQLQWQRSEDPHGNPWFAIVIDPLRSLAKNKPEIKAFRVYPPEYTPPMYETPDGTLVTSDTERVQKWGACWNRYYELEVSYFMSELSQTTLGILKNNFMWQDSFTSTPSHETDHQQRELDKLKSIVDKTSSSSSSSSSSMNRGGMSSSTFSGEYSMSGFEMRPEKRGILSSSNVDQCVDIASNQCQCCASQLIKYSLFKRQPSSSSSSLVVAVGENVRSRDDSFCTVINNQALLSLTDTTPLTTTTTTATTIMNATTIITASTTATSNTSQNNDNSTTTAIAMDI